MNRRVVLAVLGLTTSVALAETRVPGTYTYYSVSKDPISDLNTSYVAVDEQYDKNTDTFFTIQCSNGDQPEVWTKLVSKNTLLDPDQADQGVMPAVVMRLGTDAPITLSAASLSTVVNSKEEVQPDRLALSATMTRAIVNGMLAGKKLVVRIQRDGGGQPLTFTFPAKGFATAWKAIKGCK